MKSFPLIYFIKAMIIAALLVAGIFYASAASKVPMFAKVVAEEIR